MKKPAIKQALLIQALSADIFLKRSQCGLIADDSVSDTENVSSSNWREFDGGIIAHAGGGGGFTHGAWTGGVDPQALTTSGNISTQSFIFSSRIG